MGGTLTIAGIKFCAAIMGVITPSYDSCTKAVFSIGMPSDSWFRSPTINGSMPNPFKKPEGFECVEWAEYDIFDGTKGTSYFCWRPAKFIFDMQTARFHWELE